MTKPIMVVKIPCELLCVIKVKGFFHINNQLNFLALIDIRALVADSFTTETSWRYLISDLLVADSFTMLLLLGLALFLHPRCFCLAYHYFLYKSDHSAYPINS